MRVVVLYCFGGRLSHTRERQAKFIAMQERQLQFREEQRQAKNREMVAETSRAGRKLLDAIAKRGAGAPQ